MPLSFTVPRSGLQRRSLLRAALAIAPWCAALLLTAQPSAAADAAIRYHGLAPVEPTALVLQQELVVISCPPAEDRLHCTVTAHYVIANPSAERIELTVPVVADGLPELGIVCDGATAAIGARMIRVAVDAGRTSVVDVTFSLEFEAHAPAAAGGLGGELSPLKARHPVLGGDTSFAAPHPVFFHWARNWAQVIKRDIDVRYPSGWKLHGSQWQAQGPIALQKVSGEMAGSEVPVDVDLRRARPAVPLANGGPVVAAGSALGEGFRMRYGYEMGMFDWMLPSVNADVDYAGLLVLAPGVEAATSARMPVPSFSAGLGLPVRLSPNTRVGARLKASAVLYVGIEATIDYYPSDDTWETVIAGRLSL